MLLTTQQAAERLGIKIETLYAYVSRGRLSSVAVDGSRERHYRSEDIDAFIAARGGAKAVTAPAPRLLMPVIASSICLIEDGRLYYRGQDAVRLSDSATLEEVAALLWGEWPNATAPATRKRRAASEAPKISRSRNRAAASDDLGIIERCQLRLTELSASDLQALDLSRGGIARTGRQVLYELTAAIIGQPPSEVPVHRQLAAHWQVDAAGADLIRRCLVLLADHELNASTFVARCVASTKANPHLVVSAALGSLSGQRHGGASSRAEAAFHVLKPTGDPIMAMAGRLFRGDDLPGIGHPLYPDGDPRAVAILYALSVRVPHARRLVGRQPNVDFALAAAVTALDLPQGAALSLFVIGRTVGWIAHAIEQYESGILIRPRAEYTGLRPS